MVANGGGWLPQHLSGCGNFFGRIFMDAKIGTTEQPPHRKKGPVIKRGMPTAAQVAKRENYNVRFFVERKDVTFKATCRVIDSQRQRPNLYMADPAAASRFAVDLNHLLEFKAVVRNVEALRDIVANMIAMESVADMDELTDVCDRNRRLLERLEIGPFKPANRADGYNTVSTEDALYEKYALDPKDPIGSRKEDDED
jgi:hypothetical protein